MRRALRLVPLAALVLNLAPVAARANQGGVALKWLDARAALVPETQGESQEDRIATLGAAFIAEVLGPRPRTPKVLPAKGAKGMRDIIASVEAGRAGYDAVVFSATVRPPKPPSRMTLGEIFAWIRATPNQNHAIGRYQIVPKTLASLCRRLGVSEHEVFSPRMQDRMADTLLADAGMAEFLGGTLTRKAFMENAAAIWAGLPASNGKSVYAGIAGNAAGMSWRAYLARMAEVFPE